MEMVNLLPSALKVCVIVCSHFVMFLGYVTRFRLRACDLYQGLNPAGRRKRLQGKLSPR